MTGQSPRMFPARVPDSDQAALRFAEQSDAALCTIVGIDGSFSRRLGAQLAIGPDGSIVGSLADGCLERELATQALAARSTGEPLLIRYGQGSPVIDFRLPCGSGLEILIDPRPDRRSLTETVAALDRREAASLTLAVERQELLRERPYLPTARLIIPGAGPEAEELAQLAAFYGVEVELLGPGTGLSVGQAPVDLRVDRYTAVTLLFHDHEWESTLLDGALATPAFYIGALGGRITRENRQALLNQHGHSFDQIGRVRSPIGLIPHARDARTLALSVLADVIAAYETLRP